MGDVVSHLAVASGCPLGKPAILVGQRHRHAVDLQLQHPLDRLIAPQLLGRAGRPGGQVALGVGVVHREHRADMPHRGQLIDGRIANPLRGALGRDQIGMRRFKLPQLLKQPVVVEVADDGRRLDVVAAIVFADLLPQPLDPGGSGGGHSVGFP